MTRAEVDRNGDGPQAASVNFVWHKMQPQSHTPTYLHSTRMIMIHERVNFVISALAIEHKSRGTKRTDLNEMDHDQVCSAISIGHALGMCNKRW